MGAIRERRELLRRVVEFENFAACYDNERDAAPARVSDVRSLVNTKDSFTRTALEREHEAEARRHEHRERLEREAKRRSDLALARLTGLFAESNPYRRAKAFESVLNDLFSASGILVRESFTLVDDAGTAEQIDGEIEVDGRLFLVEATWLSAPVDIDAVSRPLGAAIFSWFCDKVRPCLTRPFACAGSPFGLPASSWLPRSRLRRPRSTTRPAST